MNTTDQLIAEVHRYGADLHVVDGRLKAILPARLPAHLKAELRAAAAEIKARLQTAAQPMTCPGVGRIARLDAERYEADRQASRGYDFDCDAPSHAEYLDRTGQRCVCQIPRAEQREREIDRLARSDGWISPSPAHAIMATCRRYGVALHIDATTGELVVGKAGAKATEPTQPWPSLLIAIEEHLEAVSLKPRPEGGGAQTTADDDARF